MANEALKVVSGALPSLATIAVTGVALDLTTKAFDTKRLKKLGYSF